jgi:hypothetical protein
MALPLLYYKHAQGERSEPGMIGYGYYILYQADLPFQNGPSPALNYWFFQNFYALRPVSF